MYTESSEEAPKWAKTMIEGMVRMNTRLAETVHALYERQNIIEAKIDGKEPEKEPTTKDVEPFSAEMNEIMSKLFI